MQLKKTIHWICILYWTMQNMNKTIKRWDSQSTFRMSVINLRIFLSKYHSNWSSFLFITYFCVLQTMFFITIAWWFLLFSSNLHKPIFSAWHCLLLYFSLVFFYSFSENVLHPQKCCFEKRKSAWLHGYKSERYRIWKFVFHFFGNFDAIFLCNALYNVHTTSTLALIGKRH